MIYRMCKSINSYSLILAFFFFATTFAHGTQRLKSNGQPQLEYSYQLPKKIDDGMEISSLYEVGINQIRINDLMQATFEAPYLNGVNNE